MPSIWSLTGEAGKKMDNTPRSFETLVASGMKLSFKNLATDTLTWTQHLATLASTAEIIPELGQVVELYRNGIKFFRGHVTGSRQVGRRVDTTVSGPWWWLENEYLQTTKVDSTGGLASRPTFKFPQQTLTLSLIQLLDAAVAIGMPMTRGALADTYTAPETKLNLTSYAQAISEIIRMTPDMVLYYDYSGALPAARTVRRLGGINGSAVPLTLDARQCKDFELTPLASLQVSQVAAPYLLRDANNKLKYATQNAGSAALGKVSLYTVSGNELGDTAPELIPGVPVVVPSVQIQTVSSSTYDFHYRDAKFAAAVKNYGFVDSNWTTAKSTVVIYTKLMKEIAKQKGWPIKTLTGYFNGSNNFTGTQGNYLFLGDLPDWAVTQLGARKVDYKGEVSCYVQSSKTYNGTTAVPDVAWSHPVTKSLESGARIAKGWISKPNSRLWYACKWMIREVLWSGWLLDKSYPTPTLIFKKPNPTPGGSSEAYRAPPSDFTGGLLAAQNYLPYAGKTSFVEDDAGSSRYLHRCLNFSNSQPQHASIYAMVTEEALDLGTGTTTLYLGPPARFAYAELVNRIRPDPNAQIIQA
jgi:hypothetical protein